MSTLRVLVLEDDYCQAQAIKAVLESTGHTVVGPLRDADSAAHHADDIDAALLDIKLGEGTSIELAWTLQKRGVPFAFVSGYPRSYVPGPGPLRRAAFLPKPWQPDELLSLIAGLRGGPAVLPAPRPRAARRLKRRSLNV